MVLSFRVLWMGERRGPQGDWGGGCPCKPRQDRRSRHGREVVTLYCFHKYPHEAPLQKPAAGRCRLQKEGNSRSRRRSKQAASSKQQQYLVGPGQEQNAYQQQQQGKDGSGMLHLTCCTSRAFISRVYRLNKSPRYKHNPSRPGAPTGQLSREGTPKIKKITTTAVKP